MSDVHNHDEELNEEDNIVILKDEDGNDVRFEFLDFIEYENENYIVLLPADEDAEDADEVVILKKKKKLKKAKTMLVLIMKKH